MTAFPQNVVNVLADRLDFVLDDHTVLKRALRLNDPNLSLGIFVTEWQPQLDSSEIGQFEPTLNRYQFQIQNLVNDYEEQHGRDIFSVNAKIVKAILYRDQTLRVTLESLSEVVLETRETFMRHGVARQRYLSGQVATNFSFLATTDYWIETEATRL